MKKINRVIIFLFLSLVVFNYASAETVWTCESINGNSIKFDTKESCLDSGSGCKTECKESGTPEVVTPLQDNTSDENDRYDLLAPIEQAGLDYISYDPNNEEKFVGTYLNKLFLLGIGLISAIAVIMLIVAGIQYMGEESIFGKGKKKDQMTNALLGLLIALGSYALLNTISPDLIGNKGLKIRRVSATLDERVHGDTAHQPIMKDGIAYYCQDGKYKEGSVWGDEDRKDENDIKAKLEAKNIHVKENYPCTHVDPKKKCTSLYDLDTTGVMGLRSKCPNCEITITGGTECWLHSQDSLHRPGSGIVDLRITTTLANYIETDSETRPDELGTVFKKDGSEFLKENGTHYHVVSW
jgi:hypothetical protein